MEREAAGPDGLAAATHLLVTRVRAAALIALGSLVAFGLADVYAPERPPPWAMGLKGAQVLVVLWALERLRVPGGFARALRTAFVFVSGLMIVAAAAAIVRADLMTLPVLYVMVVLCAAVLVPWGPWFQVALACVATGSLCVVYIVLADLRAGFPYPGFAVLLGCGVSVFTAAEIDRQRRARQQAEAALRESEARFRGMADGAPVLIWMADTHGRPVYLNAAWTRFSGRNVEAFDAEAIWDGVHPEDRPRLAAATRSALAAHAPWEHEYRLRDVSGAYRWVLTRGVPRYDATGAFAGHIGTATDITARKEEAEALAAARNAAEEATRLKSDFLATMSHEIRTPMHGIFGMTELALDTADDRERREFLERARACAKALMALLDEILDFSKIEAGRLELKPADFDLRELAHEVMETVGMAASRRGVELLVSVADSLPARVHADAARLRQVLMNLAGNAVKFTMRGEVELRIAPAPAATDGAPALRIVVRDTGIGIPPERLGSIFEAFTQADRAVGEQYGGTGLGLAITRRLVGVMGGHIEVASTPGAGSTFTVDVPVAAAQDVVIAAEPLPVGLDGVRALVVDDNATNRLIVMKTLERHGCAVALASGGLEAIDLATAWARRGSPFDVVLLDVHMPGLDGIETARRLRAHVDLGVVPVILLSSIEAPMPALGPESGVVRALVKPVRQAALLQAVREALASARCSRDGAAPVRAAAAT